MAPSTRFPRCCTSAATHPGCGQRGTHETRTCRVKSKQDLVRTLDQHNKNRGLQFDAEMLRCCGQHARVLRRVDHVIEEATGKMMPFPNDCIILVVSRYRCK
jgi:hypothetical protein